MFNTTREIIEAHKQECMEDRARTREMFQEVRLSQKETEVRLEKSLQEIATKFALEQTTHHIDNQRRFDKLEAQMSSLTAKIAGLIAGIAVLSWFVEHYHLLSGLERSLN